MREQPLATYVHCIGHCVNLATEAALTESTIIRDAVSTVNEIGVLSSQSGKFEKLFEGAASSLYDKFVRLRPLCPTRWTVRAKAIQHVVDQYEPILKALGEMSKLTGESAIRAAGLLTKLDQCNTFLALLMASDIIGLLETLNRSLQSKQKTLSGTKVAIELVLKSLDAKRQRKDTHDESQLDSGTCPGSNATYSDPNDQTAGGSDGEGITNVEDKEHYLSLYDKALDKQVELDLEEIKAPRPRRVPRRYTGPADAFQPASAEEYFRIEYYKLLDTARSRLNDVIKQEGVKTYELLESCLLSGIVSKVCSRYPEIDIDLLRIQLEMFRRQFKYSTVDEAASILRSSVRPVQELFNQVDILVRLLLVIPVTSCEAERSFSGLRRLKTWLRSTMTQKRLNHVAICNVHHDYIDQLDLTQLVNTFVSACDRRQQLFAKF